MAVAGVMQSLPSGFLGRLGILAILVVIYMAYKHASRDKRRDSMPPGPKGYPIVGNLLALTDADKIPDLTRQWAKQYGPVVYTKMGAQDWVWLNSPKAIKDLIDKRSGKYSSRPRLPMMFEATSNENRIIFMPYGERWRNLRKIAHAGLNANISATYKPVQEFESKQLIYELCHAKDDKAFYDINRRYSASVIMTVTYGHRVSSWDDPWIKDIYSVLTRFTLASEPGRWLVDAFPSLASLPSWMVQGWWDTGRAWHQLDREIYLNYYRTLVKQIQEGTAPDCFIRDFYESGPEKFGIDEEAAAYAAGSLVEAGSESTSTVLNAWTLACQLFPRVLKEAQEEMDRVVGQDRMPTFEDEHDLPYIRAMVKETLRWWPITKTGMNHATTEDDWYEGHFIPKGSVVMLNWWAAHNSRWKDGQEYDPKRFLDDPHSTAECVNIADANLRDHFAYGSGRRICQGLHVAQNSLFITMAKIVWAFNIERAIDDNGTEVEPKLDVMPGFLMIPAPFRARFVPRSKKHAAILDAEWTKAKKEGLDWSRTKTMRAKA